MAGRQVSKRCKICATTFHPVSSMAQVCSIPCSLRLIERRKDRAGKLEALAAKRRIREAKIKVKTRGQWMKEAQGAFNAWIRARDLGLPCISCGAQMNDDGLLTGSRIDAGHYRSVGACPELRFHPANVNAQCVKCNRHLSGNNVGYRIGLVQRIGVERVEWLEGKHEAQKHTIDDLSEMVRHYKSEARRLKKAKE